MTITCLIQNPTVNVYLRAIGLVSCNKDKKKSTLSYPAKLAAIFVLHHLSLRSGPGRVCHLFSDQGQGHGMNIPPDTSTISKLCSIRAS